jgi:hypothetical protein
VLKIATFAKPENVGSNNDKTNSNKKKEISNDFHAYSSLLF